jgi:hypothetical protein
VIFTPNGIEDEGSDDDKGVDGVDGVDGNDCSP